MKKNGAKRPNRSRPLPETEHETGGVSQHISHKERPIPGDIYPVIDTDLARDNLENDIPAADLEDL